MSSSEMKSTPTAPEAGEDTTLCDDALLWIVRLHSGMAEPQDWEHYAQWRATSTAHDQAALEAQALWDSMSNLHVEPASGLIKLERRQTRPSRRDFLLGCAGVGIAGAIGGGAWSSGVFHRLSADYATSTAVSRTVELSDGSRVFLNARSAIDIRFEAFMREVVLLEGQAYFEVTSDAARPFEVIVGDISVTALGTAFDVARELPDAAAEIAVVEHAVRIRSRAGHLNASADIQAGQSVAIDKTGRIGAIREQDVSVTGAWRDGMYIAEDRPLSDVVAALSAWHPGVILITDPSLRSLTINTVLDLKNPVGSLNVLRAGLPIHVRHVSRYVSIISKS